MGINPLRRLKELNQSINPVELSKLARDQGALVKDQVNECKKQTPIMSRWANGVEAQVIAMENITEQLTRIADALEKKE